MTRDFWVAAEVRNSLQNLQSPNDSLSEKSQQSFFGRQNSLSSTSSSGHSEGENSPSIKLFDEKTFMKKQDLFPVRGTFGNFGVNVHGLTAIMEDNMDCEEEEEQA